MVYQREPSGSLAEIRRFRNRIKKVDQELCQGTTLCPLFLLKAEIICSRWGCVKTFSWAETSAPDKWPPFRLSTVNSVFIVSDSGDAKVNLSPTPHELTWKRLTGTK